MSDTTGSAAASVTSFDAHLTQQHGSEVLSIQNNFSATWGGKLETVTTSGSNVYVNGTLVGTYSFSNQDLVFDFSSANSDPNILGVLLQSVAYQDQSTEHGTALSNAVSFSFGTSSGSVSAPSAAITIDPYQLSQAGLSTSFLDISNTGFVTSATATTYVGTPTKLLTGLTLFGTATSDVFEAANIFGGPNVFQAGGYTLGPMFISILNPVSGDHLSFDATPDPSAGYSATLEPNGSWVINGGGTLFYSAPNVLEYLGLSAGGSDYGYVASHITYENTSDTQPSTAQVVFGGNGNEGVNGPGQEHLPPQSIVVPLPVTINPKPLPAVAIETATVTSGAAVSGTAGTSGTGALAGDSDANAGYTLSVSAVTRGTLGSALPRTYGDLKLKADGSFRYPAHSPPTEAPPIAPASG